MEEKERMDLAGERLGGLVGELAGRDDPIGAFFRKQGELLQDIVAIYREPEKHATAEMNRRLYADITGEAYEESFTNPDVCARVFEAYGKKAALHFNWLATHVRDAITAAYDGDAWVVCIWLELFLELAGSLEDAEPEEIGTILSEAVYYFMHDYDELRVERDIRELVVPDTDSRMYKLVMESDHSNPDYLYGFGDYISENELGVARFLSSLPEERLTETARTFTEGYRAGFVYAGIDLSQKKSVELRYNIGFEPMVKKVVEQFADIGLKTTLRRRTNTNVFGVVSTAPNRQYRYDHRFDDALYLNQAYVTERLKYAKKALEKYRDEATGYAGPAVIETFGEALFLPKKKESAPAYTDEQEKLHVGYQRDFALLRDKYIPGDSWSYSIISYPIPEIGEQFETLFDETVTINTLDMNLYRQVHQALIDTLDTGAYVRVLGRGDNRTDIRVMLHELTDPQTQTNFENCLADVNIPVGEVFTSPVLTGTEGVLHVSYVYLNGLRYDDLELHFKDGMITDYSCGNYEDRETGRAFIRENILHNHDTLPIGEFAIGTNTYAYVTGRRYGIEAMLPILIAEKTGPHFAVGDTCYSMSEEVVVRNPDGKEIIARDNECSIKRKENPAEAYFQCHTDITIPYGELGSISVFTKEGKETIIIRDGRFVLPGTEALNEPLDAWEGE